MAPLWHLGTSLIVVVLSSSVDISSALYWECCPLNLSRYFIINFIAACSGACGYLAHKRLEDPAIRPDRGQILANSKPLFPAA